MPFIVSVVGQKGGIGKTTTAMSLAAVLSEAGRVLVVDTDPQGSATWWARRAGERLPFDFVSDTGSSGLGQLRGLSHDVVIIDTPGSLEARNVLSTVIYASDLVILPTQPAALTLVPLLRTVSEVVTPRRAPHRVLLNIVDPRSRTETEEARALLDRHGIGCFESTVRRYRAHERGPLDGLVVTQYPTRDRYSLRALDDYRKVAVEVLGLGRSRLVSSMRATLAPDQPPADVDGPPADVEPQPTVIDLRTPSPPDAVPAARPELRSWFEDTLTS
jgi:chromosome partitioning protein